MQGNILLVDDDRDFAEGLAELLDLEGFATDVALNKAEAITRNERFAPDIAILDIRLGNEDGLSLIRDLRDRNPELQCVMLTGFAALNTAVDAVRLGAQDYLMKPVEREQLRAVLERCMRMRALVDAERQARDALEDSEQRYRLLTDLSPVGVFQTDPRGGYTMVNPRWLELTGMSGTAPLGRGWQDALHEDDRARVAAAWEESVSGGKPFSAEFRLKRGDRRPAWVLGQALPQLSDGKGAAGYIGTLTDITAHKELEQRRADTRRGEALESVAGGIAHHMNNALQIISGYIQLTRERTEPGSDAQNYLELTSRGLTRLSSMTRNLLQFTGATIFDFADVNANALIADLHSQFLHNSDAPVFFDLKLAANLWPARSEKGQLRSAFDAIVGNAVDAMQGDGTLHIGTANRTLDDPPAGLPVGDYVEVIFRDSGPGMSAEVAERALEPFFTTKGPQATGLGLSMAQGIVRKSKGAIVIASRPGDGTTVSVYLPRSEKT